MKRSVSNRELIANVNDSEDEGEGEAPPGRPMTLQEAKREKEATVDKTSGKEWLRKALRGERGTNSPLALSTRDPLGADAVLRKGTKKGKPDFDITRRSTKEGTPTNRRVAKPGHDLPSPVRSEMETVAVIYHGYAAPLSSPTLSDGAKTNTNSNGSAHSVSISSGNGRVAAYTPMERLRRASLGLDDSAAAKFATKSAQIGLPSAFRVHKF